MRMLQPRQKWFGVSTNINVGYLVLVKEDSVKRGCWPKAIVDECYPGRRQTSLQSARANSRRCAASRHICDKQL